MANNPTDLTNPANNEILLIHGNQEAAVSPYGASLRGYGRRLPGGEFQEIITRYGGADTMPRPAGVRSLSGEEVGKKIGGQGDVLIPFPGRIRDGAYTFEGRQYRMEQNDKEGPNAIHGFLRLVTWEHQQEGNRSVQFTTTMNAADFAARGYPFSLRARVSYRLGDEGLACSFEITNTGESAAPVAAGFHPYFTTGTPLIDTVELHVPMASLLEFDGLLPTGNTTPVAGTPLDFRTPRRIGFTSFNNCYLNPQRDADGLLRLRLRDPDSGRAVTVWMDTAFDYVVIYSGDPLPEEHRRRALAIEPMTCGSDAFNHPGWGLVILGAGQTVSGSWGAFDE